MSDKRKCSCVHEWMDEKYGAGMRVMNPTAKSINTYRCTVCGKEVTGSAHVSGPMIIGRKKK